MWLQPIGRRPFAPAQPLSQINVGIGSCGPEPAFRIAKKIETRPTRSNTRSQPLPPDPNGGLIVTASLQATVHSRLIVSLAARYKLPAVYPNRPHVAAGGLVSYGPLFLDQYRRAADYVDRILKGTNPADLPVQAPTEFEMAINLKTAKALGLTIPEALLATAVGDAA